MAERVARDQVVRHRARVNHLATKLPPGSFAAAAWAGLQDSVPRAGVLSLHARVDGTAPDSWEDPALAQIWFRGGADYLVPRADVGVFSLGSYPRDPEEGARLDRLADEIQRVTAGETLTVREVSDRLGLDQPTRIRAAGLTGRALIRGDASNIWLIPVDRPAIEAEAARRELARRFLRAFAPSTRQRLATWTGVAPRDAAATWTALEPELVAVEIEGSRETRFLLAPDLDALRSAGPIEGVRLVPYDDAFTKLDRDLLVTDETHRGAVFPSSGQGRGFIPGAIVVDGEIVGVWQRRQRRVTIHPWVRLPAVVREAVEAEALAFPIAGPADARVTWA